MSFEAANSFFGLVTAAAAVVTAGTAITAVKIAKRQTEAWRHQQVFQRQAQCAEELLVSARQVIETLRAARYHRANTEEQVESLVVRDGETQRVTDPFAPVSIRLRKQAEYLARFEALAFKAKIIIGSEIWRRSTELVLLWFRLDRTASMLSIRHMHTDLSNDRGEDVLLVHSYGNRPDDEFDMRLREVLENLEADLARFFTITAAEK